jgi:hypothetical protein
MKKLKIEIWHLVFWFGSFLEHYGEKLESKGIEESEAIFREDPKMVQYAKKRGLVL